MPNSLSTAVDLALDSPPQLLIGTIFFALMLAMVTATAYRLIGRRASDPTTALTALLAAANLATLLIGAGYVKASIDARGPGTTHAAGMGRPPGPPPLFPPMSGRFFEAADVDDDGRVTPEEAAEAAADWVRGSLPEGEGALDPPGFQRAFRRQFSPNGPFAAAGMPAGPWVGPPAPDVP